MGALFWAILSGIMAILEIIIPGLVTIWFALSALIVMFLSNFIGDSLIQFLIFAVLSIIFLIFTRPVLRKYIELMSITKIKLELKKHIKPIFTFFLMATTITLYTNLDTILLGFFSTEEEVGFYVTALKIKNILVTIITSFGAVLLPRLSYYITQKKIRDYRRIIKQSLNYILIISIPVTIYFILFSKLTILILAGEAYLKSILLMKVLLPTVILSSL